MPLHAVRPIYRQSNTPIPPLPPKKKFQIGQEYGFLSPSRLRDPGWTTELPSKQEKYLITHLRAWSIAMEHAKNYEIRCKII